MLRPLQQVMLTVLLGPEDPKAWARWKKSEYGRKWDSENREKKLASSRKYRLANREKVLASSRKWRLANPEKEAASSRKWKLANSEKEAASSRKWYLANLEKKAASSRKWASENRRKKLASSRRQRQKPGFLERVRAYKRRRRVSDPEYKLLENLRVRIWNVLCGRSKSARTLELLGCTIPELRTHLEARFKPGMSWENYGQWHVDHKRPCASFNLVDPAQQRECFNWTNLQPLWAGENLSKGAKCDRLT